MERRHRVVIQYLELIFIKNTQIQKKLLFKIQQFRYYNKSNKNLPRLKKIRYISIHPT